MNAPLADVCSHVCLTIVPFGVVTKSSLIVLRHAFSVRQREEIVDTSRLEKFRVRQGMANFVRLETTDKIKRRAHPVWLDR